MTGKRILIVDDELDVLETLKSLLSDCDVTTAFNFNEAKELLEKQYFDIAVLDIMGVNGYKLLEIARKRNVTAVILTAHALSSEDIVRSYNEGAASYLPKDEMADIKVFLNEVLEAKQKGESSWWRWLDRWSSYYDKKFGSDWQNKDREFWEKFKYWI